ncbi:MAG: hypothetical protein ACI3YA_02875 [Alloprevotella sp.]
MEMKKINHFISGAIVPLAALTLTLGFTACSDDDKDNITQPERNWSTDGGLRAADNLLFDGNVIGNGDDEFVFTGKQTLPKGTYTLKGFVYIADGAELTIEPGTIIKGDKQTKGTLIVERGGKLYAQGTSTQPIVFTSAQAAGNRRPGDWGGLILCGRAPHNAGEAQIEGGPRTKHGGDQPADCSGALSYVRIEFAGYPYETDKEINGLTLGSVGSGTQLDHIQVSYSNDDSFEWFGGNVNAKYLVAYKGWDDDFDTDNGYSGNVQFALSVRDARIADKSQSNGFESDNDASGSSASPRTSCTFSNVTFIGPKLTATDFVNDASYITGGQMNPNNGSGLGKFQAAMHIRRGSRLNCINSLAAGWPIGVIYDGEKGDTQTAAEAGQLSLNHVWLADMDITGSDANKLYSDVLVTGYDANKQPVTDATQTSFSSRFFQAGAGNQSPLFSSLALQASTYAPSLTTPVVPAAGSPLIGAAGWDGITADYFSRVNYIGAFAAGDNWLNGWTEFDPQNAAY